jgi:WD40 repeat protein
LGFSIPLTTGLRIRYAPTVCGEGTELCIVFTAGILTGGQPCSALACQNGFPSSMAMVSTSDTALHALDIAAGAPIATISSAHERPIEKLAFIPASPFGNADTAAVACNTVLASSKGNIRLWDVRSLKPIRQFLATAGQVGQKGACAAAAAVSACGCLVACGASDPAAVILYDVRTGGAIQTLKVPFKRSRIQFH